MKEVSVFAPASVANLAVGFDILGLALPYPGDVITARHSAQPGFKITKITGDEGKLPLDAHKNTAGVAVTAMLRHYNQIQVNVDLIINKNMPFGSGLGSSAASAAGAVVAVNELLQLGLSKTELLPFAVLGEQAADGSYHADNVAPSLFGGILFIRDTSSLDVIQLPVPDHLHVLVVHPQVELLTKDARNILRHEVTLKDHVRQSGNLAGFIAGLYRSDLDLLSRSSEDIIIEPQRARLIPGFNPIKEIARNSAGFIGCSISGAGPSIFILYDDRLFDQMNFTAQINQVYTRLNLSVDFFDGQINTEGVKLI